MTSQVYDVRVEGELGDQLLRYLDCQHRLEPPRAVIRLDAITASELEWFLQACREQGLEVEGVRVL